LDQCEYITKQGKDCVNAVYSEIEELASKEKNHSDHWYWNVDPYWIDVAIRWVQGDNSYQICTDYGIYEGNFIRAMLKLSNLVEEWVTMATLTQDVEMLETLRDYRTLIVRDTVVPDSLYLRL